MVHINEELLREQLANKEKLSEHFEHLAKTHPCMGGEAHFRYGRIHLPVSPTCNIQCKFCKRGSEKGVNRPGLSSLLLTPREAADTVGKALELEPNIRVAGIAGPGDTLATDYALETFELIRERYPQLHLCLSTNGLRLYEKADRLAKIGVDTVTVTVNAVDPEILKDICSFVIVDNRRIDGAEGAKILIENQLRGIRRAAELGLVVKINSVLVPGINDRHIEEIARVTERLGAQILNIIPLIPQNELAHLEAPDCVMLEKTRLEAGRYLDVFRHCQHCRADACGIPGISDIHEQLYGDRQVAETFSHG